MAPRESVLGFRRTVQQLDLDTKALTRPLQELCSVGSVACGARRDGTHSGHAARRHDVAKLIQYVQHPTDGVITQPAIGIDAVTEPRDARQTLPKNLAVVDEQPRGVGAAVHDGDWAWRRAVRCAHDLAPRSTRRSSTQSPTGSKPPASRYARCACRHFTPRAVPPTPPLGRGPR